jgi:transposase
MVTDQALAVYGGIDTHADTHHVAVLDRTGRRLGDMQVPATSAGYRAALKFFSRWPGLSVVGIECTGSYGAGVTRAARTAGLRVVEVNRPNRFQRRLQGKTDTFDAYSAAEAVLSGRATAAPKGGDGLVESLRVLRTSRSSALSARTATINQIKAMLISAPDQLRSRYQGLSNIKLIAALVASRPTATPVTAAEATAYSLRLLARRWQGLTEQIQDLNTHLERLLSDHTPALMSVFGVGRDTAAQLLITAGDNPDRLRSEASFAALTGSCPVPASSGKTNRHRLNRAGDRQANSALYHVVIVRMRYDETTRAYVERRTAEGRTKKEIIRCLIG